MLNNSYVDMLQNNSELLCKVKQKNSSKTFNLSKSILLIPVSQTVATETDSPTNQAADPEKTSQDMTQPPTTNNMINPETNSQETTEPSILPQTEGAIDSESNISNTTQPTSETTNPETNQKSTAEHSISPRSYIYITSIISIFIYLDITP